MSSSILAAVERVRARFRQDVADQLRTAAEDAGLAATLTLDHERAVLEFDESLVDGPSPRVVATFNDDSDGGSDRVHLYAETGDERTTLLTLAWRIAPGLEDEAALQLRLAQLETLTDERLPLERRGLNAPADERTGRYAKGDVIRQLAADLKRAAAQESPVRAQSHPLVVIEPLRSVTARVPDRRSASEDSGRISQQVALAGNNLETQRANVTELLISSLMQRDLAEAESHFVGPGVAASARGHLGRVMEWAMLGTAYGVEAKTNQIAVSSFLGAGSASWLYALVGPVLIGGLWAVDVLGARDGEHHFLGQRLSRPGAGVFSQAGRRRGIEASHRPG